MPDGGTIQRMFAEVAPGYDRANLALSFGVDRYWRRRAVRFVGAKAGELGLDACSGTGDLAFALERAGARVIATDFCAPMLVRAHDKRGVVRSAAAGSVVAGPPEFLAADTLALPFGDSTFDFATVAFGIRNVADPLAGLREMARVVKPGGRVLVLEFCRPKAPVFRSVYSFYFNRVLPKLGGWISGARCDAYQYLHDSVQAFPERERFLELMTAAGLSAPRQSILTGGIAALYRGEVTR